VRIAHAPRARDLFDLLRIFNGALAHRSRDTTLLASAPVLRQKLDRLRDKLRGGTPELAGDLSQITVLATSQCGQNRAFAVRDDFRAWRRTMTGLPMDNEGGPMPENVMRALQ
jgi:hypothetical protein